MFYIMIGIVFFVAVGAFIQRSRHTSSPQQDDAGQIDGEIPTAAVGTGDVPDAVILSMGADKVAPKAPIDVPSVESPPPEDTEALQLRPVLAAEPISSPGALSSATYSSIAPSSLAGDSPYAHGNTLEESKPKAETTLLRWSGKTGVVQVGELTLRGPVAYWSNGSSSISEPSCVDVTLPVEYPAEGQELPNEGALSYKEMTPLQRGVYLLWLAGGRIQPPFHLCYPALWLFGLERRVLSDKLDISICIGEAFRLLPLVRWESLQQGLIKFVTWMAAKIWMPEDQLLAFCRILPKIPIEILNMLLRPYADAKLPLPSLIAFTVMRTSPLADEQKFPIPDNEETLAKFAAKYKSACQGGVVLTKPKSSQFVAYVPTNPSLTGDKNAVGGVLELPDFFKDPTDFTTLISLWFDFAKTFAPPEPLSPAEQVAERPDWQSFVTELRGGEVEEVDPETLSSPLITTLGALAELMRVERKEDEPRGEDSDQPRRDRGPAAADRKKINDTARVEGFLVLPNLGIAGKKYHWDDSVVLTPLEMGGRLSQDYNSASLLLEFASLLLGEEADITDTLESLRERLDTYFSLSSDDRLRLEALSIVLLTHPSGPENLGECFQFWLQRDQRGTIRDFMLDLLLPSPLSEEVKIHLPSRLDTLLDLEKNTPPPTDKKLLELGERVTKALAPLFKE